MFATSTAPESLICFDCGKFYKAEEEFSAHLASCDVNVDGDDDDEEDIKDDDEVDLVNDASCRQHCIVFSSPLDARLKMLKC